MSDEFFIVPFVVRAAGTDVPPEQIQAAINSICQQVTADLNLIVSGGFPQTNVDITGGTITGVTGATQGRLDNSLLLATDAFVNQQGASAVATVPFANVTGGVYNQATLGSGLTVVVFASGGVITSSLTISNPGSGYAVGDLVAVAAGNSDAVLRVTGVSGSGVTSVGIAYGGTGYSTGIVATAMAVPPGRRAVVFTGALTSNLTFIIQNGTYLTASREVEFINNTTGGFTITVFLSNGAGGHTGNGVVLPQGTNDSTALSVYTDGQNDVWLANSPAGIGAATTAGTLAQFAATTSAQLAGVISDETGTGSLVFANGSAINPTSTGATTPGSVAATTLSASGAVSGTGFTNLLAPYALLASPALTGTPTAPTAGAGTNTTQLATTAFVSAALAGRLLNVQRLTSTGTYTPTTGTNKVIVELVGGGAGGGGCAASGATTGGAAAGGGSGSYAKVLLTSGFSGVTVTLGALGAGGTAGANVGSAGGQSTFGGLITCPGGIGGTGATPSVTTGIPVATTTVAALPTTSGTVIQLSPGSVGGMGISAGVTAVASGFGGPNPLGPGAPGVASSVAGQAAVTAGTGGSGAASANSGAAMAGGNGAAAVCIIYEYA